MTEEEIARARARARAAAAAVETAPDTGRTGLGQAQHVAEATLVRPAMEGLVGGVAGLPAMAGDALAGVAHRVVNRIQGKGAEADQPWFDRPGSMTTRVGQAAQVAPDALGLDVAETPGERVAAATTSGLAGAIGPLGIGGALIKTAGTGARVGTALTRNPGTQMGVGGAAGAAAQGASEAGINETGAMGVGVATGVGIPLLAARSGRVSITSRAGQEAVAGEFLRNRAANVTAAAANLENPQTSIPGYRLRSTDAARDPGLAQVAPKVREWSNVLEGGAAAQLVEDNSTLLSRELDRRGAIPGTADRLRQAQRSTDQRELGRMDLENQDRIDVTDLLEDLRHNADPSVSNNSPEVARANSIIARRIQGSSQPVRDAEGNPTGAYTINPEALHGVRKSLNAQRNSNVLSDTSPSAGVMRNAHTETKPAMDEIANRIDDVVGGDYNRWREGAAGARLEADRAEFMEEFGKRVHGSNGARTSTGDRVINEGGWLAMNEKRDTVSLAGAKKNQTVETLDPERRQFIQGAAEDINRGRYAERMARTNQSTTALQQNIDKELNTLIASRRSPGAKVIDPAMRLVGMGANFAGKATGALAANPVSRGLSTFGQEAMSNRLGEAQTAVRGILGASELTPQEMRRLMLLPRAYNPGFMGTAVQRSGAGALGGINSFLASERESRYR